MKEKDFNELIEKRFNKKELKEIDRKAKLIMGKNPLKRHRPFSETKNKLLKDHEVALGYLRESCESKNFKQAIKDVFDANKESFVYDKEQGIYHGEISSKKEMVTFQGASMEELEKACIESFIDYFNK